MECMHKVESIKHTWISASLSCANLLHLEKTVQDINSSDIDFIHYDVVDGKFNSCFVFGDCVLSNIRPICEKPIEVHLAVEDVRPYIEPFAKAGADYIAVHYEIEDNIMEVFDLIRKAGAKPILAFRCNSEIPDDFIELTVHPGYAGQRMQLQALDHMRKMKALIDRHHLSTRIQADGNICEETIPYICEAGATILTGGTSGLFKKNQSLQASIKKMKEVIV